MHARKRQSGFTIFEILFGAAILALAASFIVPAINQYIFEYRVGISAAKISKIPLAAQRRVAHDNFLFSFWDNNGGTTGDGDAISWDEDSFYDFLNNYLVGRKNSICGNSSEGWNPINTNGGPDDGEETQMERTALVPCNSFSSYFPYNIKPSALLTPDANGSVGTFALYLNMENVDFGSQDDEENNIMNFILLSSNLEHSLYDAQNGSPELHYGEINDLSNIDDDLTEDANWCEEQLLNNQRCDIIVYINFSGTTNGFFKTTGDQNSFLDDVTFKQSVGVENKQQCAYWEKDASGNWTSQNVVDCAIKAGSGDDDVVMVFDGAQANEFVVTNEANLNGLCKVFERSDEASSENKLIETTNQSPCGILPDGDVVQLITSKVFATELYGEDLISDRVFSGQVTLFNDINGASVIEVFDSAHSDSQVFNLNNNGDVYAAGELNVDGDATFESSATVRDNLIVEDNVTMAMSNNSEIKLGNPDGNYGLEMRRENGDTFIISSNGVNFELLSNNNEGIRYTEGPDGLEIRLDAEDGVKTENGTSIYSSRSTLTNSDFGTNGVNSDALKNRARLVTEDALKYVHDMNSGVQVVGLDRVEGEFTTLNKPNCLAFAQDSQYSTPEANPYRELIDSGAIDPNNGYAYARLVLLPMYFKTYNSAFGDNQIFAQHASHSTPTTWDIYLYLSGEGAFGTGAREDGAGGSLAMTLCDYSSINFYNYPGRN